MTPISSLNVICLKMSINSRRNCHTVLAQQLVFISWMLAICSTKYYDTVHLPLEKKKIFLSLNHNTLLLHMFLLLIPIPLSLPPLISSPCLIDNFVTTFIPCPPILQHHNDLLSYISHSFSITLVMRFHLHPNTFIPFLLLTFHFHHMTCGLLAQGCNYWFLVLMITKLM